MAPSELSLALASYDWDTAINLVRAQPNLARVFSQRLGFFEGKHASTVLPLHEAVTGIAPASVAKAILEAYPDAVRQEESAYKRLPLHCACRKNADPSVVHLLLESYAAAALIPDTLGRLPLHYALSNGADPVILNLILTYMPAAARGVDMKGWFPLHVACSVGASTPVIVRLLELYPEAVVCRTEKGSMPHTLVRPDAVNHDEVRQILQRARNDFDQAFVNPLNAYVPKAEDLVFV